MSVISKQLFYEKISEEITCKHVHIWNENCIKANLSLSLWAFWGGLKFFLPIYIIKALVRKKKIRDKTFWKEFLVEHVRSAFYGLLMANLLQLEICASCKLNGRLNYYNLGLLAGFTSGLGLLVESKENRLLDTLIFFNMLVEAVLKNLNHFNKFKLTNTREIVMFMGMSSLLMHLLQNREKGKKLRNFWFYTPSTLKQYSNISKSSIETKCGHKESCSQYTLKGVQKYFMLGYLYSIVRKLLPKMLSLAGKPSQLFSILINKDNFRFGVFIGAYVGIYRYLVCYLLKTNIVNQKYSGAIAGLVSGATYAISPNLQVLTVGITTVLQVFYNQILGYLHIRNMWPQQFVFMISHALLMHNAIMCRDTCPKYYSTILDTVSNNLFSALYKALIVKHII